MSAQPSPGYARNSDSSANSSPLLPFNNKPLPADNGFADEDGWGATGGYDEGSPQYGNSSHAVNQDRERQDDGMTGQDEREHGRQEYGQQSEAGPSRKRPRLEDGYSNPHSHTNSHNGTPQPQHPRQNQHQQHQHPQRAHAQAHRANPNDGYGDFAIPFPHQMPLPDRSKEIYLLGVQDPDLRNRSPYQPVPRIIMHSILGFTPRNEVSREIGEWLLVTCGHLPGNVEIEIKFGHITAKGQKDRLRLPVKTEVLLDDRSIEIGFRSDMPEWAHASMNKLLNQSASQTTDKAGHPEYPPHSYYPIKATHQRTDDTFYNPLILPGQDPINSPAFVQRFGRGRRRLTKRSGTSEIVECMQKVKIGNVHVYCPMEAFDYRVSVNCEFPCKAPSIDEPYSGLRKKDRVTYTHNLFQIDLTQVKTFEDNGSSGKISHELELEILDAKRFLGYGYKEKQGVDPENRWEEALDCVLNSVRLLNKNCVKPA